MTKSVLGLAVLSAAVMASAASAAPVFSGNLPTSKVEVNSPLDNTPLDKYTITLGVAEADQKLTAANFTVTGGVFQVQVANFIGAVSPTTSIDHLAGFPQNFIDADTHILLPSTGLLNPGPPTGNITEGVLASRGNNAPTEGTVPSFTFQNIALTAPNQAQSVVLLQVVVPRGGKATLTGEIAATNSPGGIPEAITIPIGIPEPGSLALASMGLVALGFRRRRVA